SPMDTPVLITHKTAWLVHHAPQDLVQAIAQHDYQIGARGLSTQQRITRIRQALTDCGIPTSMLETIDISVVFAFERIRANGVNCHVLGQNLPYDHIDGLSPGIFITDEALTFVFAAEWMGRIEYLEYGYEVCGDYRMGLNPDGPYTSTSYFQERNCQSSIGTPANPVTHAPDSRSGISTTTQPHPWRPHPLSPFHSRRAKAVASRVELNKPLEIPKHFGIAPKLERSKSTLCYL
ncbi:MAG: hypothetical protein ACLTXI_02825, partial [Collinsella sp.]